MLTVFGLKYIIFAGQSSLTRLDCLLQASRWCTRGVDLLASQQIEQCNTEYGAQIALRDIEEFLEMGQELRLSDPREFRATFDKILSPEMNVRLSRIATYCSSHWL